MGQKSRPLGGLSLNYKGSYESKMVVHIYFMFRIYLESHLKLFLKQLKVLKRVRLGVELCFRLRAILYG